MNKIVKRILVGLSTFILGVVVLVIIIFFGLIILEKTDQRKIDEEAGIYMEQTTLIPKYFH